MANDRTTLDALRRSPATLVDEPSRGERVPLVRFTVDLPESDHHALKLFALNSRVTMSDTMRALVSLLREESELAARVVRRARQL